MRPLEQVFNATDIVLQSAPNHKDALLVKADALQWQGRYVDAVPIYQDLIARDGDFDARAGLARSMLAVGNRAAALENLGLLKPANARQKRDWSLRGQIFPESPT